VTQIGWIPADLTADIHPYLEAYGEITLPARLMTAPPRLTNVWVDIDIQHLQQTYPLAIHSVAPVVVDAVAAVSASALDLSEAKTPDEPLRVVHPSTSAARATESVTTIRGGGLLSWLRNLFS
jgi:hypothetical protein